MNTRTILKSLGALVAASSTFAFSAPANACGEDAYYGQICITAAFSCPRNTAEANGAFLAIANNTALYSLLGTTYGGDGHTTFALPDLRGNAPVGYAINGPVESFHQVGDRYGSETTTLTVSQLAPHNHLAVFTPDSSGGGGQSGSAAQVAVSEDPGTSDSPAGGKYLAKATTGFDPVLIYNDGTNLTPLAGVSGGGGGGSSSGGTVTVGSTGKAAPVSVVAPRIAMRYCIVTNGLYPPRD